MAYDYDLFVIGAGSGGVRASRIAAGHGARVGICEDYRVGGTCVIRGCVPKKLLVYGSKFAHEFEDAAAYGWTVCQSGAFLADLARQRAEGGRPPERRLSPPARRRRREAAYGPRPVDGPAHDRGRPARRSRPRRSWSPPAGGRSCRTFPAGNSPSPRTRRSICRSCPSASPSWAAATSPSSSPASSTGSVATSTWCCGATACCAASTRSAAPPCTRR